jgi:hypothetical protein
MKQAEASEAERDLKTTKGLTQIRNREAGETGGVHGGCMKHDRQASFGLSSN